MKSLKIPLSEKLNKFLPRDEICEIDHTNKQIIIKNRNTDAKIIINLVGAHGLAGSGKDTLCDVVYMSLEKINNNNSLGKEDDSVPRFLCKKFSFAGTLKKACSKIFGIDSQHFEEHEHKEREHIYWEMSPRRIAQLVGTEGMREGFDKNVWINSVEWQIIRQLSEYDFGFLRKQIEDVYKTNENKPIQIFLFISDVRFENEASWIRNSGGRMLFVTRSERTEVPAHDSENGIRFRRDLGDVLIENNDSLYNYMKKIERTFQELYFSRNHISVPQNRV